MAFPSEEWLAGAWNSLLMSEKAQKPKDIEKTGKTYVLLTSVVPGNKLQRFHFSLPGKKVNTGFYGLTF